MFAAPSHDHRAQKGDPDHDVELELVDADQRNAADIAADDIDEIEPDPGNQAERENALDPECDPAADPINGAV